VVYLCAATSFEEGVFADAGGCLCYLIYLI
jgi:hypothetical protein